MKKLDKDTIIKKLEALNDLPNIKEVRALKTRLNNELAKIDKAERKKAEIIPIQTSPKPFMTPARIVGYQRVRGKAKSYWSMINLAFKASKVTGLNLSKLEIRREFTKKRKNNADRQIPDVVWQNLSPLSH